jgi:antitoxin (DNA-binding transcriptional repressor) of toxin-antitoxin stability system
MSTVNMRELSRNTKAVIEDVVRSGRPAIVTINGRPQVAVTPIIGAVEAAEEHVLRNAPAQIQAAIREGEADLIAGKVSLVDDAKFADLGEEPVSGNVMLATLADQLDTGGLDEAIRSAADGDGVDDVRQALMAIDVFTLGYPSGDTSVAGTGTESEILTYSDEAEHSQACDLLPVFTQVDALRSALTRNPEWQTLDVLRISGKELIVVNPWSDLEFRVPHRGQPRTLPTEEAVVSAAELMAAGA